MDKEYSAGTCLWVGTALGFISYPLLSLMNMSELLGWIGFLVALLIFGILIWVGIGGGNWDEKKMKMENYLDEKHLKEEALYVWRRKDK